MRFLRSERGGLLPFTLIVLGTVILMGALAVNTVRVEHSRSISQSVLDICVLNAAAQRQTLPPRDVLDDCLQKHGFEATIKTFDAEVGRVKSVTATAEMEVESFFLQDPVIYDIGVASTAQEEFTNLEIVLALDLSGSMSGQPLLDLKAAAKQFVDTILSEDTQGNIKITLLPFNAHVNLGADLAQRFNVTNAPLNLMFGTTRIGPDVSQMRCLDLPDSSYSSTAVSTTTAIPASPFLDLQGSTSIANSYTAPTNATFAVPSMLNNPCTFAPSAPAPATNNVVFPPEYGTDTLGTPAERILALQNRIDGLQAVGDFTSINRAMRWSLAFLDPAMQGVFAGLRDDDRMPPSTDGHPRAFSDPATIKVIVLMSDGANTEEQRVRPQYQSGPSPFWIGNDGNISWYNPLRPAPNQYWVPHVTAPAGTAPGAWQATPWRGASTGAAARQMDYSEVWRRLRLTYVAWQFHARSVNQYNGTVPTLRLAANNARNSAYDAAMAEYRPPSLTVSAATKDNQLTEACNLARDLDINVYSLFFVTDTANSPTLESCARTPSFFYRASSTTIRQAFADIALNISRLQLTE